MKRLIAIACIGWGCGATPTSSPPPSTSPTRVATNPNGTASACPPNATPTSQPTAMVVPAPSRLDLPLGSASVKVPAGRWAIRVETSERNYVSIGIVGPRDALVSFEVLHKRLSRLRTGTIDADGRLPAFVSFQNRKGKALLAIVDVDAPVTLIRSEVPIYVAPKKDAPKKHTALALVGLPFPIEKGAGYTMQAPHRYQFARADVAAALRAAFKQTRRRFKRNPIAIGDISQWNGIRPATDLGKARHISHQFGRDVDIGLPVRKGESILTRRCEGILVEKDVLKCGPGTVQHVDGMRLAYFLGLLIDGPTPGGRYVRNEKRRPGPIALVETIFTDQAYIDEIRKALPELKKKRWIHDEAHSALAEEGLLRPSAWHVDHVHIRFAGAPATVPSVLDFAPPVPE